MKSTLSALVLCALVASAWTVDTSSSSYSQTIKLVPGQSYIYSYSGRMLSGIAQYQQNAAIWEIKSDIVLQAEQHGQHIAMQMTNIRIGKHNGPIAQQMFGGEMNIEHERSEQYEQELSKPIRFYWDNGQIKNFEADQTDAEWSINMKKSILSLFNINLTPKRVAMNKVNDIRRQHQQQQPLVVYPVYEDGMNGICETYYQIVKTGQVLNVTKTRNYNNCLTRPAFETTNSDFRGAPVICHKGNNYPLISGYYPMVGQDFQVGSCEQSAQKEQEKSPVKLYHYVRYNISADEQQSSSALKIDAIYGQGKTILQSKDKQLIMISEQNITLVDRLDNTKLAPIKQVRQIMLHQELSYRLPSSSVSEPMDIPYYQLYGSVDKEELQQLIVELLDSVANDVEATQVEPSKNTMQKVVQMANAVAVLDSEYFDKIFEQVAQQGRSKDATDHQRIVRRLFLDLLSYAGTTESALYAKQLYDQEKITTEEAKEMFEAVPQNLFLVDAKVVEAYLNVLLSDRTQEKRNLASSVGIALGKLIKQAAIKQTQSNVDIHDAQTIRRQQYAQEQVHQNSIAGQRKRFARSAPWHQHFKQQLMDEQQVKQVIKIIEQALKSCSSFDQKVTLIETLAHTGTEEALAILAPYIQDKVSAEELPGYQVDNEKQLAEERNFIRQVTIYALSHMTDSNGPLVSSLLLPIFNNKYEPYEIRIAAFTVMLTCDPGKAVLEQISSAMHQETNRQVKSFVVSSLKTVSEFKEPSTAKLARDARFALAFAPKDTYSMLYSKMVGQSYYDEKKQYGMNLMAEWVASNVSQIPRSGYLAAREIDGPTENIFFEAGYNVKGLDNVIGQLFREQKQFLQKTLEQSKQKQNIYKRAVDSAQSLVGKLFNSIRAEDEPKATVFLKLFERTSYYTFDREFVQKLMNQAKQTIESAVNDLGKGQDYHYVKLAMPKQMYKVVSSEIGLPVIVTQRHPTIVSVKLNQAQLKASADRSIGFSVQVEPSIYHTEFQFIYGLTPLTTEAVGTNIEKCARIAAPFDVSVSYNTQTSEFKWSVTPKVPQEVFHHQTQTRTFVTKSVIAGSSQRQWLEGSTLIGSSSANAQGQSSSVSGDEYQQSKYHYEREYFKKDIGIGFKVKVDSDSAAQIESAKQHEKQFSSASRSNLDNMIAKLFMKVMAGSEQITPCTTHIILESDETTPVTGIEGQFQYTKQHIIAGQVDEKQKRFEQSYQQDIEHLKQMHKKAQQQQQQRSTSQDEIAILAHSLKITAQTQSAPSKSYTLDVFFGHTYDQQSYWTRAQAKAGHRDGKSICLQSWMNYEATPSPFSYESIKSQDMKANLVAKVKFIDQSSSSFYYGQHDEQCQIEQLDQDEQQTQSDESYVLVKGVMKTGQPESVEQSPMDWFYQQCANDQSNGQQSSYACQRALTEQSYFKRITMDITYDNLPQKLANLTSKLALAAKVAFYDHLDVNEVVESIDNQLEKKHIRINAEYSNIDSNEPLVNVKIDTAEQVVRLDNVPSTCFRPPSALLSTGQVYSQLLIGSASLMDQCHIMSNYIRTFDNVTIPIDRTMNGQSGQSCQYLVAKDCSESNKFSIYATVVDQQTKAKQVTMIVDGKQIVMQPAQQGQQQPSITIDGERIHLDDSQAMRSGDIIIYAQQTVGHHIQTIIIKHERHGIHMLYDGKNVMVKLAQQYKGETCGVCGDDNHESDQEFVGPDQCIYDNQDDFINSYADEQCPTRQTECTTGQYRGKSSQSIDNTWTKRTTSTTGSSNSEQQRSSLSSLIGQWSADLKQMQQRYQQQQMARSAMLARQQQHLARMASVQQQQKQQQQQQQQKQQKESSSKSNTKNELYRTMSLMQSDRVCFSVQPTLACIEGRSRPTQYQQQVLAFHCLPSGSISAQKLYQQSQYQVLEIFGNKQVDFYANVKVPVSCQAV